MFQLNGYKFSSQSKWIGKNRKIILARSGVVIFTTVIALALMFIVPAVYFGAIPVGYVLQVIVNKPRKAKKPFVYTARIKRLYFTAFLLLAGILIIRINSGYVFTAFFSMLVIILLPFIVMLANLINLPIEKMINRHYINDAKKKLKTMPNLIVIGITGSYGKTSTKYFLQRILSEKYNVLMTPESYNTTLGVVRTIREQLKPIHEIFICEMGARGVGQIKEICDIVHPKIGILTSIGPQHLETFYTIENIIKTKFELIDSLPADGMAFLNYDNEYIKKHEVSKNKLSFGLTQGLDYSAKGLTATENGSAFTLSFPDGSEEFFETKLLGNHNAQNLAGALATADYLGVEKKAMQLSLRRLESVPHRLQLLRRGGNVIIDDAYNSNSAGAKAALEALGMFENGYKILVTPGMVELGDRQDECNRAFGMQAARVCDFVILMGKKQTLSIREGLDIERYPEEKIYVAETLQDAFSKIAALQIGNIQKVILLENDLTDNY
jgi:UDP-N-acetylmuramoyl-tripeptide--D-alanyl-D-alanine ligase